MSYLPTRDRDALRKKGQGLISENFNLGIGASASLMIHQRAYYIAIGLKKGDIITNIHVSVATVGTTSTNLFVGLYNSANARLAVSSDLTTALDSGVNFHALALSAPYTVLADGIYKVALLCLTTGGTAGNMPTLYRGQSGSSANETPVTGFVATCRVESSLSALPTTATPLLVSPLNFWVGVS